MPEMAIAWSVVAAVVALAIGVGVGVLSMTPPDFTIARVCFAFAALVLGSMTIFWAARSSEPSWWRITACILVGVAVFVILPAGLRWVSHLESDRLKRTNEHPAGGNAISISGSSDIHFINPQITHGGVMSSPPLQIQVLPQDRFVRQTVRISDLPLADGLFLRGKVFEHCTLVGPAIIAPLQDYRFQGCKFGDVQSVIWPMPNPEGQVIGAIGIQGCSFVDCVFDKIALAVPPDQVESVRKQLSGGASGVSH